MPPALLRCIAPVFLVWRQDADGAEAGAAWEQRKAVAVTPQITVPVHLCRAPRRRRKVTKAGKDPGQKPAREETPLRKFEQNLDLMRRSSTRFYTTQEVEKVLDSDNEEETPYMKNQTAS